MKLIAIFWLGTFLGPFALAATTYDKIDGRCYKRDILSYSGCQKLFEEDTKEADACRKILAQYPQLDPHAYETGQLRLRDSERVYPGITAYTKKLGFQMSHIIRCSQTSEERLHACLRSVEITCPLTPETAGQSR